MDLKSINKSERDEARREDEGEKRPLGKESNTSQKKALCPFAFKLCPSRPTQPTPL